MGLISTLFENPAVKILEEHLWEGARKRYLREHPEEVRDDTGTLMRKVRAAYKGAVDATLKEAELKVRAKWGQFKHVMTQELRTAFATVLRMSNVEWYAIEVGQLSTPKVLAVPYQLLKRMTADVLLQYLKKEIDTENLDDQTLGALASYSADQKFENVLEDARRRHESFTIGDRDGHFAVVDIIKRDAYYLGEEKHHSLLDMVILSSVGTGPSNGNRDAEKAALKDWSERDRKNRKNERRFSGDGWELGSEELKSWATVP